MQFPEWEFLQEHGSLSRDDVCDDVRFNPTGIFNAKYHFPNSVAAKENLQVLLQDEDQIQSADPPKFATQEQIQALIYSKKHEALVKEIVNEIILPPASSAEKVLSKKYDHISEMLEVSEIPAVEVEEPFLIEHNMEEDDDEISEKDKKKKIEVKGNQDCRKGSISRWQCTGLGALCSLGMAMATFLILTQGKGHKLLHTRVQGEEKRTNQVEREACITMKSSGRAKWETAETKSNGTPGGYPDWLLL